MRFLITLACENGHEQKLTTDGMTEEMARDYAAILDGTSSFFIHPPHPESKLHKCCHPDCGKPFKATVEPVSGFGPGQHHDPFAKPHDPGM